MKTENTRSYPEFRYIMDLICHRLGDSGKPEFPEYSTWRLPIAKFILENKLSATEATLLLIGIIPHIDPNLFDEVIGQSKADFPQIGGVRGKNGRFFLPTGVTALFLIAANDIDNRLKVQQYFGAEHHFWEKKVLWLEDMQNGEPSMDGRLIISPDYVDLFTYGIHKSPQFSINFPAKKIAPSKLPNAPDFDQLVISDDLRQQINELKNWLKYNERLMNEFGMRTKLKPGYRTLFYGPPGTGKTFSAQILGNDLKKEVFKIDLSMIVSKYIGETEKNLELLFARAEDKEWILFFDEADSLFGKRTNVKDAHDKYANQEVSYLLQRIEEFKGLVILATNKKSNIDGGFTRRFNSILSFPFPNISQRALIWKKALSNKIDEEKNIENKNAIEISEKVKKYELSGGSIMNVVHYAGIKAVERISGNKMPEVRTVEIEEEYIKDDNFKDSDGSNEDARVLIFHLSDVKDGIKRELTKEGKPFVE